MVSYADEVSSSVLLVAIAVVSSSVVVCRAVVETLVDVLEPSVGATVVNSSVVVSVVSSPDGIIDDVDTGHSIALRTSAPLKSTGPSQTGWSSTKLLFTSNSCRYCSEQSQCQGLSFKYIFASVPRKQSNVPGLTLVSLLPIRWICLTLLQMSWKTPTSSDVMCELRRYRLVSEGRLAKVPCRSVSSNELYSSESISRRGSVAEPVRFFGPIPSRLLSMVRRVSEYFIGLSTYGSI